MHLGLGNERQTANVNQPKKFLAFAASNGSKQVAGAWLMLVAKGEASQGLGLDQSSPRSNISSD